MRRFVREHLHHAEVVRVVLGRCFSLKRAKRLATSLRIRRNVIVGGEVVEDLQAVFALCARGIGLPVGHVVNIPSGPGGTTVKLNE